MISIGISIIIVILSIILGFIIEYRTFKTIFDGVIGSFSFGGITAMLAFVVCLVCGVSFAPYKGYTDYEITTYGDKVFYFDDDNKICEVEKGTYKIIADKNIEAPQYRIIHYDTSVFYKADGYEIVLPE